MYVCLYMCVCFSAESDGDSKSERERETEVIKAIKKTRKGRSANAIPLCSCNSNFAHCHSVCFFVSCPWVAGETPVGQSAWLDRPSPAA